MIYYCSQIQNNKILKFLPELFLLIDIHSTRRLLYFFIVTYKQYMLLIFLLMLNVLSFELHIINNNHKNMSIFFFFYCIKVCFIIIINYICLFYLLDLISCFIIIHDIPNYFLSYTNLTPLICLFY